MTKWARIKTSQWHLMHSVRAGSRRVWNGMAKESTVEPYEFILTQDGYELPTERYANWYANFMGTDNTKVPTGAKVWEGEGYPKGPICDRCSSFLAHQKDSVEISL